MGMAREKERCTCRVGGDETESRNKKKIVYRLGPSALVWGYYS